MSYTARLVQLLGAFRRERNGLAADTMHYDGARYGLNYGVSLPTIRRIARSETPDHAFARYLYQQDVRCLQLTALHLADPTRLTDPAEADFWLSGLRNSEMAEEAAFALLARCEGLERLTIESPLAHYARLMALARRPQPAIDWVERSLALLQTQPDQPDPSDYLPRLLLHATICLWAHIAEESEAGHQKVTETLAALGHTAWEEQLREELAWRL